MFGLRTLQRYLSIIVATVLQINIKAFGILLHPGPVLVDISSIDDVRTLRGIVLQQRFEIAELKAEIERLTNQINR